MAFENVSELKYRFSQSEYAKKRKSSIFTGHWNNEKFLVCTDSAYYVDFIKLLQKFCMSSVIHYEQSNQKIAETKVHMP